MTVIAVMKKDEERKFIVSAYDGDTVTLCEEGQKEKSIGLKTFKRSYKLVDGELEDLLNGEPRMEGIFDGITTDKTGEGILEDLKGYVKPEPIKSDPLPECMLSAEELAAQVEHQEEAPRVGATKTWEEKQAIMERAGQEALAKLYGGSAPEVAVDGWDLTPRNTDPRLASGPAIVQESIHSANSMQASRDERGKVKPFKPEPFFLRQSMISSYLQCPDKFYDTYENGYNEDTIFTKTGTAIHGIMEDFYKNPAAADVSALFEQWWKSHSTPEWDWYRDWKGMVTDYFARQLTREQPEVLALEYEFQTGVNGLGEINGVPVSGTIDRIDRIDARTIKIKDYKTNFQPFSNTDLNESKQFMMYSSVLHKLKHVFGDFDTIICEYDMLRLGYTQEVTFDMETLQEFEAWMAMIWGKMLEGRDRAPQLNQYCSFCQKRATCPLYQQQLEAPISEILTENTDLEHVTNEKDRLAMVKKMVDNRIKEIDEQVKTAISTSGEGEIIIGDHVWSTKASTRTSYPADAVIRTLAMHGLADKLGDIVTVGSTNMKRILKDNPEVLQAIDGVAVTSYTAPSLSKRKVKKGDQA